MGTRVPAEVFPPGEFIREELEAREWTQGDLAAIVGKPVETINRIISGKLGISTDTARLLAEAFGTGPEYWLNLDAAYRLWNSDEPASQAGAVALKAKVYDKAPVTELVRRKWIAGSGDANELKRQVLTMFDINDIDEPVVFAAAARKSTGYGHFTPSQLAWLFRARKLASTLSVERFSQKKLRESLPSLRELSVYREDARRVPALLASLGIRFVIVERLQKTKIDGAAFWLRASSPVIAMSHRHDRIDNFWFTLSHEIGHILEGDKLSLDSELCESEPDDDIEKRADDFASNFLVPKEEMDDFILRVDPLYSKVKIRGFANRISVHSGIVVGQLQGKKKIQHSHSREMLVKVRDLVTSSALTDGWGHDPHPSLMVT